MLSVTWFRGLSSAHFAASIYRLAFLPWKFGLVENVSLPVDFSGLAQNCGVQCCLCFVAGWISFMEIGGPDSATINGFSNSISNGFGFIVPHMGLYMRRVTGSWMPHLCVTTAPHMCRTILLLVPQSISLDILSKKASLSFQADHFEGSFGYMAVNFDAT